MRSPFALTFAFALVLSPSLLACGGDDDGGDDSTEDDGDDAPSDACGDIEGLCIELAPVAEGTDNEQVQAALIDAQPGDVILFTAGEYVFDAGLSLDVDGVTLRGEGETETILSFAGQTDGAEGLLVTANDFTVEDLAVEDTAGDGIKVEGGDNIIFRGVRVEWLGGPSADNGAYGIYPVLCSDVLVEDSIVSGASDAGIYVGQTERAVVRRNLVENNVAGIEIENTFEADVYENTATGNTGGILVFNLPDLEVINAGGTRVFDNEIVENNTENFAPKGNIVGEVPRGTGMVLLAAHEVEVYGNLIADNLSANIAIISYFVTEIAIEDKTYDPYPDTLYIHDNELVGGGTDPDPEKRLGLALQIALTAIPAKERPDAVPDIVFDGILDEERVDPKFGDVYLPEFSICFQANGDADFLDIDAENLLGGEPLPSLDDTLYDCDREPVPEVVLDGVPL
jgi:parallel beta-helix repeat protein